MRNALCVMRKVNKQFSNLRKTQNAKRKTKIKEYK